MKAFSGRTEKYHSLYEYNSDGILSCSMDGVIVCVNPAVEKITGYGLEDLVDREFFSLALIVGWHGAHEVEFRHKNGHSLYLEIRDIPIMEESGMSGFYILLKDVTKERKLLSELEEAKQALQQTVSGQQGMTYKYKEIGGRYIHTLCDGELMHRMGFNSEDIVGRELKDFLPAESAERIERYYRRAWSGEVHVVYEETLTGITSLVLLKPIKNDSGTVTEVIASCVDISDRKRAEESLLEAETLYREVVENALIGVYLYQDSQLIYANPYLTRLFDYEALQKELDQIALGDINSGIPFSVRGLKKDGTIIQLRGQSSTITYKGKPAVIGTVQDVTYKKEVENILHESAMRYQRLIEFLPEAIVISHEGIVLYANMSTVKLARAADKSELVGKHIFEFVHPDEHLYSKGIIEQVMQTDEPSNFYERKFICVDGTIIEAEVSHIRIHNYLGNTVMVSVLRDLTDRKQAEELLIKSEKLSIVGQLAAGIAHEIRNPLTALKGFTQLLKSQPAKQAYLDIMLSELDRINFIVTEFMSLAKPQVIHFAKRNLCELVYTVVTIMEPQALLKGVVIRMECEDGLPPVNCDDNQLKQVFVNIITNAIEAMPSGGIVEVNVGCRQPEHIGVTIKDQGLGIPQEHIRKIGEPFYTTKEKGTGLGLMICQRILEAHKGTIKLFSEQDIGTTVDVLFPVELAQDAWRR